MYPFKTMPKVIDSPSQNINSINSAVDNQWPNQAVYQNVDLEKVDWAALAQQWIHMKEACPNEEPILEAPPPPNISKPDRLDLLEEQGEAPMEVERDDDVMENEVNFSTYPMHQNDLLDLQEQPNWNNAVGAEQQNQRQWPKKTPGWNTWTNPNIPNQSKSYRPPLLADPFNNNIKQENFWPQNANSTSSLGSGNSFDSSPHVSNTNLKSGSPLVNTVDLLPSPLDAAQRKTLPAWIREGLEKMEKEKQKEADRIRELKERDEHLKRGTFNKDLNINELAGSYNSQPSVYHIKSKFESESDDSDSDGAPQIDNKSDANQKYSPPKSPTVPSVKPHRTKIEILQDIMLMVRTNLTEILLEVTNEEIKSLANETLSKMRSRGRKAQTVQKNALSGIGLGLVTYDDSDGGQSNSESEDESDTEKGDDGDSETELRETIERRKHTFEVKSLEIEAFLAEKEDKERQWLDEDDESRQTIDTKTGNDDIYKDKIETESGEVQQENNKFSSTSGRKQHERKGSRFSDAKAIMYSVPTSVQLNNATSMYGRINRTEDKPHKKETEKAIKDGNEGDSDTSSLKSSKVSRSHHEKSHRTVRHADDDDRERHHKKKRRRHSSSSSESSYSSRKSSSRDKHNKYSRDKSYSRSHSYRSDRSYSRSHSYRKSRSRSRSRDTHSSKHRHR